MRGAPPRDNGDNKGKPYRIRNPKLADSVNGYQLEVSGVDRNQTANEIKDFLFSKLDSPIAVTSCTKNLGKVSIEIQDKSHAISLLNLSGIHADNGVKLHIRATPMRSKSMMGRDKVSVIGNTLQALCTADGSAINLEDFKSKLQNFRPNFNTNSFVTTLLEQIVVKCPRVTTINFAKNEIKTLACFSKISKILPGVINLSFQENLLSDFRTLENLKGLKLRDVVFSGNPFHLNTDEATYRSEIERRFLELQFLDGKKNSTFTPVCRFKFSSGSITSESA